MEQNKQDHRAHDESPRALSRRSFLLGGCVGTASILLSPLWSRNGLTAYAADASNPTFEVFVLSVSEIGVAIVDVTGDSEKPLPGTSVVLTSSSKPDKKLTALSDENGNAIFDISEIAETLEFAGGDTMLRFDGSVEIVPPAGYRRTVLGRIRCSGGSGFRVPTRRLLQEPSAYFRSMSFNGWDIQYFDTVVYRSLLNTSKHKLEGTVEVPGDKSAKVSFVEKGGKPEDDKVLGTFDVSLDGGVGSFSLESQFLYTDHGKITLTPGKAYAFDLSCSQGTFRFDTRLSALDTPIALDAIASPFSIVPALNSETDNAVFKMPSSDNIPVPFKGSSFSIWKPSLPVLYNVSPLGIFVLGVGKDLEASNNLAAFGKGWEKETSQSAAEQFYTLDKKYEDEYNKYKSMKRGVDPNGNAVKKVDFSGSLKASFAMQAYAMFKFDWNKYVWNGSLNGIVQAGLDATFKWQTTIGPVPVFVMLQPGLEAKVALVCGVKTNSANPFDLSFDFSKAQASFTFNISIALTVGVGIAGVVSIGLRGSGYISIYTGYELLGYKAGYPLPRFVAGYGLSADLVLQAFIFKWSGNIWSFSNDRAYDSWQMYGAELESAGFRSALSSEPSELATGSAPFGSEGGGMYSHPNVIGDSGVGLADFADKASIVTNDELLVTSELNGTPKSGFRSAAVSFEAPTRQEDGSYVASMNVYEGREGGLDEYDYEYVGEDEGAYCGAPAGIEGVGAGGGLVPTVDQRIAHNVFSNPLQKIVLFHNTPIMFRIISVSYEGKTARSRIAGQRYNKDSGKWDQPVVLEIPLGNVAARFDTFDYDFDVVTNVDKRDDPAVRNGIHILLSSGIRPKGDKTSFMEAASNPIMTWAVIDEYFQTVSSYTWEDTAGKTDGGCHALTTPRIAVLPWKSKADGKTYVNCIVAAYLRRSASTPEDLFTSKATTTGDFVFLAGDKLYQGHGFAVNPETNDMTVTAHVLEQASTLQADLAFSIMSFSKDGTRISSAILRGDEHPTASSKMMLEGVYTNVQDTKDITNVQIWPGRSAFLAVKDGVLNATQFDIRKENAVLTTKQVGPSNCNFSSFRVSENGNVILFLQNQDGVGGMSFDKTGAGKPAKASVHRIQACICSGEVFSEPFALAEIKHAQDSLLAADGGSNCYAFITSCITDMTKSTADLYYTTVPVAAGIEPLGFATEHQFVTQGVPDQPFILTAKNVGNVILKGVKLQLVEADTGKAVDERYLDFSKTALCASVWNPELYEDPDPELVALKQAYPEEMLAEHAGEGNVLLDPAGSDALLPGKTGQYRVAFSIPQDWHGTVAVKLKATEYVYDTVISASGDPGSGTQPEVTSYFPPDGYALSADVTVHQESDATEHEVDDPQVWKMENGEFVAVREAEIPPESGDGSGDAGEGGPTAPVTETTVSADGKTTKEANPPMRLPASGDGPAWSLAGLAAAAAVAGITAYSARRAALEGSADADGTDERSEEGPDGE